MRSVRAMKPFRDDGGLTGGPAGGVPFRQCEGGGNPSGQSAASGHGPAPVARHVVERAARAGEGGAKRAGQIGRPQPGHPAEADGEAGGEARIGGG